MSRVLLCPPDFYQVRYEINPWMNLREVPDTALALQQWSALHHTLESLGHALEVLTPRADWPDMVFTANAGVVQGRRAVLSNFRHAERAGETPWHEAWFHAHGFEVSRLPDEVKFEGEGDFLRAGDFWFCGHGFRTELAAAAWMARWIGATVVPVKLVDPRFYHLDTCFCPLGERVALWHPQAFDHASWEVIRGRVGELIAVPESEAALFACNAVVLGRHVLLPHRCPETSAVLSSLGFTVHAHAMSEFIKAGGACKCLVLLLA